MEHKNTPKIIENIWENWRQQGGKGPCNQCPAHWSHRNDIDGTPGERTFSPVGPWFGVGSSNPDIVILGEEPGSDFEDNQNRLVEEHERERDIMSIVENSNSIEQIDTLVEKLLEEGKELYWTQAKKCNELKKGDNYAAQKKCCGINDSRSYLAEELAAVDPDCVVSLGESATSLLLKVYHHEPTWEPHFSAEVTRGPSSSGLRDLDSHSAPFEIIPAPHPGQGFTHISNEYVIDHGCSTDRRNYYRQFAIDLVEYHETCE